MQQQHKEVNDEKRRRRRSRELSAPQELLLCIFNVALLLFHLSQKELVRRRFFYRSIDFTIQSYRFSTLDVKFYSCIVMATIHFINFRSAFVAQVHVCVFSPRSNTTGTYLQHTRMNEAELCAQNTSSNHRTFTFAFAFK